jgi:hypothetical protein
MAANLAKNGVQVTQYKQIKPELPDSIFPNNWFSTHRNEIIPGKFSKPNNMFLDGVFFTYPMKAPSRQAEVNPKIVSQIGKSYAKQVVLKPSNKGESLEGTGSLVFDHKFKRVYVCISERASPSTLTSYLKTLNSHCLNGK